METIVNRISAGSSDTVPPDSFRSAHDLDNISDGVFSSMDIPPLFRYMEKSNKVGGYSEYFEDGGVIDNLPIRFGTDFERCDLLFILPLNASFEREVNHQSVIRRLARITEIRQGVLERNSFKMVYLYNELAVLRKKVAELEGASPSVTVPEGDGAVTRRSRAEKGIAETALSRKHGMVRVFSICPAPKLKLSTTEFWKTKEAAAAFSFMYEVTKNELKRFDTIVNLKDIRMAQVSPAGRRSKIAADKKEVAASTEEDLVKKNYRETENGVPYHVTYFKNF